MTLSANIYTTLTNDVGVSGFVGARVYPMDLPQNATLPAITYTEVSNVPLNNLSGENVTQNSRYQFDCFASTFDSAEALGVLLKTAMESATLYTSIRLSRVPLYDDESEQYRLVQDFSVWY